MKSRLKKSKCRRAKLRPAKTTRRCQTAPSRPPAQKKPTPAHKPAAAAPPAPFASLDFPERETLYPHELAARIGCSVDHVYDLILEGQLCAINISGDNNNTRRRCLRVPIESWRKFLSERTL